MELKQNDLGFNRFRYTIEESGIRLIKKRIASSSDTFVEFENIGDKIIKEKTRKLLWLVISILFIIFAAGVFYKRMNGGNVGAGAEFFHLSMSIIFLMIYLATKRNIVYLAQNDNTNAIEFIGTKRYKNKVDDFVRELLQRRNEFFIQKYATLDEFLPYNQQYNNLVWLYNLKLFTKSELQAKIQELDNLEMKIDNSDKNELVKIIGFKNPNKEEEDIEK